MTASKILFLCTGNYYRSRFAEHLFNHLARERDMPWTAESRGLALERGAHNVGPMSAAAVETLHALGINVEVDGRFPLAASERDFAEARRIIAIDESEHRPLMAERFPAWKDATEYWMIHDLDRTDAQTALAQIEAAVRRLVDQTPSGSAHRQPQS